MFLLHSARMVCIFLILFPSPVLVAQTTTKGPRLRTIIVDPGHGGSDQGAKGRYSTEAELTLKISLKVEEMLRKALPDTRIVMTRTIDVFHNPREKAEIANREKGDLFLCIHVNAAPPIKHRQFLRYKTVTYYRGKGSKKRNIRRSNLSIILGRRPIQPMVRLPMCLHLIGQARRQKSSWSSPDSSLMPRS